MHDCPKVQEKLFDLVLNEIELDEQQRVLADVASCSHCQAELESIEKTFLLYDQAAALNEPTPADWQIYEGNLLQRFATPAKPLKPLWQRVFFGSIQIPAPVFAAAILLLSVAGFLAFRPVTQIAPRNVTEITVQTASPEFVSAQAAATPEKIIVREERVVTRKIYVTKRASASQQPKLKLAKNSLLTESSPLNLAEFKPVRPIAPSVVKGNKSNAP